VKIFALRFINGANIVKSDGLLEKGLFLKNKFYYLVMLVYKVN